MMHNFNCNKIDDEYQSCNIMEISARNRKVRWGGNEGKVQGLYIRLFILVI